MRAHHWTKTRTKASVQMYEQEPYTTEIIDLGAARADPNPSEVQHAREQLILQSQYPGRDNKYPRPSLVSAK